MEFIRSWYSEFVGHSFKVKINQNPFIYRVIDKNVLGQGWLIYKGHCKIL